MTKRNILLDTSVLIAIENKQLNIKQAVSPDIWPILPSIAYAEVSLGIKLDTNLNRAKLKQDSLDYIKSLCVFKSFGEVEAGHLAELIAHTNKVGKKRGKYDLIIAAIARANDATIITHDRKAKFEGLPGVKVREI